MSPHERLSCRLSGGVQGVGFRWFTRQHGARLGLTGYARNLEDGRVEVVAEGPRADLEILLMYLRQGPSGARVDHCEVRFDAAAGTLGPFDIKV